MSAGFVWRDLLKSVGGNTLFKIQLNLDTLTEYITIYPRLYSTGYVGFCIHSMFSQRFVICSSYRRNRVQTYKYVCGLYRRGWKEQTTWPVLAFLGPRVCICEKGWRCYITWRNSLL